MTRPPCTDCGQPLRQRTEPDDGRVVHQARGLCSACYERGRSRQRRANGYRHKRKERPRQDPAEVEQRRATGIARANEIRRQRITAYLTPAPIEPGWEEQAACPSVGPHVFETPELAAEARAICQTCPAARSCLEGAINEEWGQPKAYRAGMRGGLTPAERTTLDRQRRRKDAA